MKKTLIFAICVFLAQPVYADYTSEGLGVFAGSFGKAMLDRQDELERQRRYEQQQQYERNLAMQQAQREQELHNMQMKLYQQQLELQRQQAAQKSIAEQEYQRRMQAFLNRPENKIFVNDLDANKAFNDAVKYVSTTDKSVKTLDEVFAKARKIALSVIQK